MALFNKKKESQEKGQKRDKYIIVSQTGKLNRRFVVRDPEKIKYWKKLAENTGALGSMVITKIEKDKS